MISGKCDECQIGRCRPENMTWLQSFGPHMVVLPSAPASRCDMCGHVRFDPAFLLTMKYLLEHFSKDPQRETTKKRSITDISHEWTPARRIS